MNLNTEFITPLDNNNLFNLSYKDQMQGGAHSSISIIDGAIDGKICKLLFKEVPNTLNSKENGSYDELEDEVAITSELSKKTHKLGVQPASLFYSLKPDNAFLIREFYLYNYNSLFDISVSERIPIAKTLLRSLYTIGVNKLLYLDIKPDNLVHDGSRFMMIDFGGATFLDKKEELSSDKDHLEEIEPYFIATPQCHPYQDVLDAHGYVLDLIDIEKPSLTSDEYQKMLTMIFPIQCFAVGVCIYNLLKGKFPYPQVECYSLNDYFDGHEEASYKTSDMTYIAEPLYLEDNFFAKLVERMIDRDWKRRPKLEEIQKYYE